MKTLKVLAVLSIAATSVFAGPESGFFVGAEVGKARLKNNAVTVYNPIASPTPEALPSRDTVNTVTVARLTAGYAFSKEWELLLSYTRFGEGEINFPGPRYPGMVFVTTPDDVRRNVIIYRTSMITLLPVYSIELARNLRVNGGVGLNYARTQSHFEQTRYTYVPATTTYYQNGDTTDNKWGLAVRLGVEYFIMDQFSVGVTATYQDAKGKASPAVAQTGATFNLKATSLLGTITWHY